MKKYGIKKRTIVFMAMLILLTGCKMPFEDEKANKEISIVVPPTEEKEEVEEIIEEEEKEPEIEEEELTEPIEEDVEEIGDGWVEPLEVEMTEEVVEEVEETVVEEYVEPTYQEPTYVQPQNYGSCLTRSGGVYWYGDQKETWYNLDMSGIVSSIQNRGWLWNDIAEEYKQNVEGEYWIRDDGCKMLGNYIMVAANLSVHPRGSLVETSLGTGVVVDTGGFAANNPLQIDIAVNW